MHSREERSPLDWTQPTTAESIKSPAILIGRVTSSKYEILIAINVWKEKEFKEMIISRFPNRERQERANADEVPTVNLSNCFKLSFNSASTLALKKLSKCRLFWIFFSVWQDSDEIFYCTEDKIMKGRFQLTAVDFPQYTERNYKKKIKRKRKQRKDKLGWWHHRSANGFYERMTNARTMWTQQIWKREKKK